MEDSGGRRADLRGRTRRPDGAVLAHQLLGPYAAPVLLLLQGQANSHQWWRRLRHDFSGSHLTVTFDYRGTGGTTMTQDVGWSTADFADDAAAVVGALGRDQVDVYATSMGGRVAQELALRHPGLVRRLVLAGTSPGGPHAVERSDDVRRALSAADPGQRRAATVDLFYTPAHVRECGGVDQVPGDLLGDPGMSPSDRRRHLQVSVGHDAYDRLPSLRAPTLVLHGEDDRMVPVVNAEILHERLPDSRVRLFPTGRHGFFDELRGEVAPLVRDFLGGGEPTA